MQGQHDLGGRPAGPIDLEAHEAEPWAKSLTAVVGALRERGLITVDEVRRALEELPQEVYDEAYFRRWAAALGNLIEEKGLVAGAEIERRMAAIRARLEGGA